MRSTETVPLVNEFHLILLDDITFTHKKMNDGTGDVEDENVLHIQRLARGYIGRKLFRRLSITNCDSPGDVEDENASVADINKGEKNEGVDGLDNVFVPPDDIQIIETGDSVKVKQVLDETVVDTIKWLRYKHDTSWENFKLFIMVVSCVFAMVAQFYPLPFPDSRPLLGVCCVGYFALSGILQFIITFVDDKTVMTTLPNNKCNVELQIDTAFPRFQQYFTFSVQPVVKGRKFMDMILGNETPSDRKLEAKMYVGRYFTEDGKYDQVGFARDIQKLMQKYQDGRYIEIKDFKDPYREINKGSKSTKCD
jgi:signal peptidase complex subunit 2